MAKGYARRDVFDLFGNPAPTDNEGPAQAPQEIDIALFSTNPFQPRTTFDPKALRELAASLKRRGVLQPLLARKAPGGDETYQIAAGERRWRAAQLAGLATIPTIVRDLDDDAMEEIGLTENIQREDLTDVELAHAFRRLLERHPDLSRRALSENLGKAHNYVDNKLKLLTDPRIEAAVAQGTIGPTVAMEIADLDDEAARTDLLARAQAGEHIRVKDVEGTRKGNGHAAMSSAVLAAPPSMPHNVAAATPSAFVREVEVVDDALGSLPNLPHNVADTSLLGAAGTSVDTPPASHTPRHSNEDPATKRTEETTDPGQVRLRDLRIIQLHTGRDGEPRQLDTADPAVVLRILEADLAWLKDTIRRAAGHPWEG